MGGKKKNKDLHLIQELPEWIENAVIWFHDFIHSTFIRIDR